MAKKTSANKLAIPTPRKVATSPKAKPKKTAKRARAREEWPAVDASNGFAVSMEYTGED